MTIAIEVIDGHTYEVGRDDQGNIAYQRANDPLSVYPPGSVTTKIRQIIQAFKSQGGSLTAAQRDKLIVLIAITLLADRDSDV